MFYASHFKRLLTKTQFKSAQEGKTGNNGAISLQLLSSVGFSYFSILYIGGFVEGSSYL
jgi:hypothetical protein